MIMSKKIFYLVTIKDGENRYSYVFWYRNNENLYSGVSTIMHYYEIETLNACDCKSDALRIAKAWNESWEQQGRLMTHPAVLYRVVYF